MDEKIRPLVHRRQPSTVRGRLYLETSIAGALSQDDLLDGSIEFAARIRARARANPELHAFAAAIELNLIELRGLVRAQHGYLSAAWSAGEQAGSPHLAEEEAG